MATIRPSINERQFTIDRFLGVNESPDGDTGLKFGEAAVLRNFHITKEGNLQLRPGYKTKATLAASHPVRGMWRGNVSGTSYLLAACNGHVYRVNTTTWAATDLGTLTDAPTHFFGFNNKVYIINGVEYKSWDGTTFGDVVGYIPIVATATPPAGGGTLLEAVNKLTGKKRQQFSPDGTSTVFQLAETAVSSIDSVEVNGTIITTGFTTDATAGTVTFTAAPTAGTSTIEIAWTKGTGDRTTIVAQLYSEMFNGSTDNRVFLYGDGTNMAYYSGIDENGNPSAEYFPDLNVLDVGTSNTPITSLIRHFNKLMAFKTDSTYLIDFDFITLSDGTTAAGFYTKAIDKDTGNIAPAQVKMVNNYPISLHGNSAYRWSLLYSSGTQDERAAKRISDSVGHTLPSLDLASAITWDDEYKREFWIVQNGTALVWNYSGEVDAGKSYKSNTWSIYTGIPAVCFVSIDGELYFGTAAGTICHISDAYRSDDGADISAYLESGAMAFEDNTRKKGLRDIYVELKPEVSSWVNVTVETNLKSDFEEKLVGGNVLNFTHINFAHWSFKTNVKPQTRRVRMKAKKFTTLKLIFSSVSASSTVTVLSCSLPVSYTSRVK